MNTQTTQQTRKVNVFDENGNTLEETELSNEETEEVEEFEASAEGEAEETQTPAPTSGKFRIGDKTFATAEEALAYAESQVSTLETENQVADAYRQGLKDALNHAPNTPQNVTPQAEPESDLNNEEFYTNPQAFLHKYAQKIKTETRAEIEQRENLKAQSDQIWREFTDRHPGLADFRAEIEDFVAKNTTEVRAIIGTKGRPASYDWIATKMKSRFESYANAVRPKRTLPNGSAGASPSTKSAGVTPKPEAKKPLSFAEQLRSIRKRG